MLRKKIEDGKTVCVYAREEEEKNGSGQLSPRISVEGYVVGLLMMCRMAAVAYAYEYLQ